MTEPETAKPPTLEPASIRGLVFDLDGTLVDSYEAIAISLNNARRHAGLRDLEPHRIRTHVGWGWNP